MAMTDLEFFKGRSFASTIRKEIEERQRKTGSKFMFKIKDLLGDVNADGSDGASMNTLVESLNFHLGKTPEPKFAPPFQDLKVLNDVDEDGSLKQANALKAIRDELDWYQLRSADDHGDDHPNLTDAHMNPVSKLAEALVTGPVVTAKRNRGRLKFWGV